MKELFEIIFNISMIVFVAGSMLTLGLSLSVSQIIEPFKNIKMVFLSIISNFIVVPLFAFALLWAFDVPEGVRIGLLLLSIGGGAPFIPKIIEVAKGKVPDAIGLMLLLLVATIIFMPLTVPRIFPGVSESAWSIAKSLVFTMLLPLTLGLFVKACFSDIAGRIQPVTAKLTNIAALVMIVAVLFLYTKAIVLHVSELPIILLFFSWCDGYWILYRGKKQGCTYHSVSRYRFTKSSRCHTGGQSKFSVGTYGCNDTTACHNHWFVDTVSPGRHNREKRFVMIF